MALISEERCNGIGLLWFQLNIKTEDRQIHRRLVLRTEPDGASSAGLVWSLAVGLFKQLHFVYSSLDQLR